MAKASRHHHTSPNMRGIDPPPEALATPVRAERSPGWEPIANILSERLSRLTKECDLPTIKTELRALYAEANATTIGALGRLILGYAAQLALNHQDLEIFNELAPCEFARSFSVSELPTLSLKLKFAGIEFQCRALLPQELWGVDDAKALGALAVELLRECDADWCHYEREDLVRLASGATMIPDRFDTKRLRQNLTFSRCAAVSGYLGALLHAIVTPKNLPAPYAAALKNALVLQPAAALQEFLDFEFNDNCREIRKHLTSDQLNDLKSISIGKMHQLALLFFRVPEMGDIINPFLQALNEWSSIWSASKRLPAEVQNLFQDLHWRPIVILCSAIESGIDCSSDPFALKRFAEVLTELLGSQKIRSLKVPATTVAPLWMSIGAAWAQYEKVVRDEDLKEGLALPAYIEACRLLTQTAECPGMLLNLCLDRIDSEVDVELLQLPERGIVYAGRGYIARQGGDNPRALHFLRAAGEALRDSIHSKDQLGLKNIAKSAARLFSQAAYAARDVGDPGEARGCFEEAAKTLERAAELFVVKDAKSELLLIANRYRETSAERFPLAP